jgi:uncharacterized protein
VHHDLEVELVRLVRRTAWMMQALGTVRSLGLPEWCIGAGALRTIVWDAVHGYPITSTLRDIDVASFDIRDISQARDDGYAVRLRRLEPNLPREVTNQAGVHDWFADIFGHVVPPLRSLDEAVASWPETATSVAVRLNSDDTSASSLPWVRRTCSTLSSAGIRHAAASQRTGSAFATSATTSVGRGRVFWRSDWFGSGGAVTWREHSTVVAGDPTHDGRPVICGARLSPGRHQWRKTTSPRRAMPPRSIRVGLQAIRMSRTLDPPCCNECPAAYS